MPVPYLSDGAGVKRIQHILGRGPGVVLCTPALPQVSCLDPSLPLWERGSKGHRTRSQQPAAITPRPKHSGTLHWPPPGTPKAPSVSTLGEALVAPAGKRSPG